MIKQNDPKPLSEEHRYIVAVYSPTDDKVANFGFPTAEARELFLNDIARADARIAIADIPTKSVS